MGDVTRRLPTTPAPASLRAAGTSGVVTIIQDPIPSIGQSGSDPARWQNGWQDTWPDCRPVVVGASGCPAVDPETEKGWDPGGRTVVSGMPFDIETQMECTLPVVAEPVGPEGIEAGQASLVADVQAAMERGLIPQVAEELFAGAVARAQIGDGNTAWDQNRWLTRDDYDDEVPSAPITIINEDTDPVPLAGAVGLLEQYLACCSDVGRGIIYAPPAVVPPLASLGNMLNSGATTGGARFSPSGHVLAAECGFTGYGPGSTETGPDQPPDGVMWLYASGPLQIRYTVMRPIGTIEDVMALFADYNNTVAMVPARAMYNWGCCHAAVAVDVSPYGLTLNPGS